MTTKQPDLLNLAAGLNNDGCSIVNIRKNPHTLEYIVSWKEPGRGDRICPECGSNHCTVKDKGTEQTIRHVPVGDRGTLLTFHKPRFKCCDCGKSFFVHPPFAAPGISISKQLFLLIYEKLTSTDRNLTEIARDTCTTADIIMNVMDHCETGKPPFLPETLCIDEFKGESGYWDPRRKRFSTEKFHCNITDGNGSQSVVIDILYQTTFSVLHDYFMEYPLFQREKVKYFCTDMRSGFSKVAKHCFPHAKICIDPFHVVKLLTEALGDVRVREQNRLREQAARADDKTRSQAEADYKLVKDSQRMLVTSPFNENRPWNNPNRADEKKARMDRIFKLCPDLKVPYEALQDFYEITHTEKLNLRQSALSDWLKRFLECGSPEVRKAALSIRLYRTGIENAWKYQKSNSPTEGLNKRIKDLKRHEFGAHSFERFRKRALLAFGYISFIQEPYTIKQERGGERK